MREDKIKKKDPSYEPGQINKIILATLGIGVILGGSILITPNFPIVLGLFIKLIQDIKGVKLPQSKVKRTLKQLEKRQILELYTKDSEVYVKVKAGWHIDMLKYSIESLLDLKKKKQWQGKWYMVLFDVPEKERNKRIYLREFLKQVGFYPYQQSVYVFPYECKQEIELIKKIVEGGKYIDYVVVESLEREKELKLKFNLV